MTDTKWFGQCGNARSTPVAHKWLIVFGLVGCWLLRADDCRAEPEGPLTVENGHLRMTVNPSVGRLVDFGRIDGPNYLRLTDDSVLTDAKPEESGYQGYGGDQLWPAQQATWGAIRGSGGTWPPLAELDGPNWTVIDQGSRHITIQAADTPLLGLRVQRRFELSETEAVMTVTNRFTRVEIVDPAETHDVMIWSVSGMVEPDFTMMGILADRPDSSPRWTNLVGNPDSIIQPLNDDQALRFDVRLHGPGQSLQSRSTKIGTHGDWLAAIYHDDIVLQRSAYQSGAKYPDDASLEIYSDQTTGREYIELEVLTESLDLALGDTLANTVSWHLLDRPAELTDSQLAVYLQSVPEPTSAVSMLTGVGILIVGAFRRTV